nr:GTP pyrophosphokinase family protein [Sellimonas caecigallum]
MSFNTLMMRYRSAIREVTTKLQVLDDELSLYGDRNPIESIQSRIKKPVSIAEKLGRMGLPVTVEAIEKNLNDVAGIRVICPFIDDIYKVANMLTCQDDITVVAVKDYIKNPKPNGYRSYHMIVEIPVFFSDCKKPMRVEVQIRTVAMDFWASLEHQIKYKKNVPEHDTLIQELKECAETIAATDEKMQNLRRRIE